MTKYDFEHLMHILSVEVHPVSYGSHEVSVYCYFPYGKVLCIYQMSKEVADRLNVESFYGYISHTYHLSVENADIIEVENQGKKCPF